MQCFSPYLVQNQYTNVNGQNRVTPVPCGKCINCKKRRSRHWVFRLDQEARRSSSVSFLTLTYDDQHLPISKNNFYTLRKKDFQLFMKNLRHLAPTNKIKYYACGEYGSEQHTVRPHYHAVLFNLPHSIINSPHLVANAWGRGISQLEYPRNTDMTTSYVTGYITKSTFEKESDYDDREPEFSLMSKKMGLNYLTPQMIKYFRDRKIFTIVKENGELISMPRYYKNKIFSPQELKEMYKEYINILDIDMENKIKDIGSEYFKRQADEIKALLRKTEINNKLKRQKL